ncbi:MAG TPA: hypothetical protein VNE82_05075 [Candidatus Binataceae bacterium]|nr:hypothetical protein [Candidatus Binataceae bacterium]
MLKKRGLVVAATAVAVALLSGRGLGTDLAIAAAPTPAAARANTENTNLYIYDTTGTTLLGRAHYTVTRQDGTVTIEGRNDFIDGERDIEHDTLKAADGEIPRMVTYDHSYFDAHGALQIVAKADAVTGKTSCAKYADGKGNIETAVLQFPSDTYAGAGVLVPVANQFRRGGATDLDIHAFDCAHGPRILTLHVDLARAPWHFRPHDGELAKADAYPVFGWFNIFLKPFVPTIQLWFDPLRDFAFVGGTLSRYYRGPELLLVSMAPPAKPPEFELPAPPELTAPPDTPPAAQ